MKTFRMLVRREFWEHRGLWIAPLICAALLLAGALFGIMKFPDAMPFNVAADMFGRSVPMFNAPLFLISGIVAFTYLLDCLYGERKDRSILFWKSLPVSDTQTILAKFFVALVALPLGVWALGLVTHLICSVVLALRYPSVPGVIHSNGLLWIQQNVLLLERVLMGSLWFAPLAAYLMLASVFSRRAPFVTAVLPPIVLGFVEQFAFQTHHLANLFLRRITWASVTGSDAWGRLGAGAQLDLSGPLQSLTDVELWAGLVIAAALLAIAIRLRRYRDDT